MVDWMSENGKKGEEKDRFSASTLANQPVHARGGVFQALFPAENQAAGSAITG
jgi:hypothetical protein